MVRAGECIGVIGYFLVLEGNWYFTSRTWEGLSSGDFISAASAWDFMSVVQEKNIATPISRNTKAKNVTPLFLRGAGRVAVVAGSYFIVLLCATGGVMLVPRRSSMAAI